MPEYISREAAIDRLNENWKRANEGSIAEACYSAAIDSIHLLPAADVVEVRYCRFSLEEARRRASVYKCSACGNYLTVRADTLNGGRADMNYCPFCGRKVMHKGQDGGKDE